MSKILLKLIFLLFSSLILIFFTQIYPIFIVFVILASLLVYLKLSLPFKYILLLLLPIYFLFALVYMIEFGFTTTVLIGSLMTSSLTILKLLSLIILNFIFIKTTSFIELSDSFTRLKLSKKFLFSITILISIIPLIFKTAKQVYDAQRLRGLNKKDFLKVDGWILFLSPLFIHIFSYSQQITLQLELKNYENIQKLEENVPEIKDYLIFILSIVFLFLIYYVDGIYKLM